MTGVIDMTTTEGLVEHLQTLPSENLTAIAARPIWNEESAKMVVAAGMILDHRAAMNAPAYDPWSCKDCQPRKCDCTFECTVCGAKSEGSPNYCGCSS